MSWKKYGGTNKLDKLNNISVNTIVTDKFTLKNFYVGDWDICGGLRVKDDAILSKDLTVQGDIHGYGNITIDGAMNVFNTNIIGNVFVAENAFVRENIYMDFSGGTVLHGENRRFGFGTLSPQATMDISGDLVRTIDIHTSTTTNKNVVARNVANQGITVNVEPTRAYIDFYVDNSMNLATENFNGRLVYDQGGNFTIDVSNIVKFKPRVVFSQDLSKNLIAEERIAIHTNPLADVPYIPTIYGDSTFKSGTATYLVAGDNSSNVFFRMGTEKGSGMTLGGGYFPGNKIMGVVALIDASNVKYPAMNVISGNLTSNLKTSVAINKYNVATTVGGENRYAMDINGPVRMAHQELIVAADISFQVYKSAFFGNTGYAVGSPVGTAPPHTQFFLKTVDGGYTWTQNRIVDSSGNPNPNSLEQGVHYFNAIYPISATDILIAGDNRYFYRTTNGGANWTRITFTSGGSETNDVINTTSIFLSNQGLPYERIIVGIDTGSILNSPTGTWNTIGVPNTYISTGLSAVNAIHGSGLDTVIVGAGGIVPYHTYPSVFGTRVATSSTFYDVKVFNDGALNHVVAVGANTIWYAHDLSWNGASYTVSWSQVAISGTLRSVQMLDASRAIAVGDAGLILYSIDGFATWKATGPIDNGSLITGLNLATISALNANDFAISGVIQNFISGSQQGRTKVFNLYAPYFLNRPNNHVLEASGNMVVSGDLQINDAGQLLTNNTTFNVFPTVAKEINVGSTAVGGNTNVKANLDVALNITGHQRMLLYGDASLNANVYVGGDASLNSKLYLVGDASLNSKVFIGGDASLNSKLYLVGDASMNSKVFIGGDVSLNSKLCVVKDASLNANLYVGGDVSMNSKLYLVGDASFNSRLYVGGDVSLNSKLYVVKDVSMNANLYVGKDVSLNSKLYLVGDASFNSRLYVGGDVSLNSKLYLVGDASLNSKVFIGGDVSLNSKLYVVKDASLNANLYVGGDVSLNSKLYLVGDASLNARLNVGGKSTIMDLSAQNADFAGIVRANTFDSRPGSSLTIGGTNAGNVVIKTSSGATNTLTLGDAGSNVVIVGNLTLPTSVISTNINNLEIKNKTILLNDEAVGTKVGNFCGLQIRDDNTDNKGYFLTNGRMDGYLFKSTQSTNRVNLDVSGLYLPGGLTQGFVLLKPNTYLDVSADYTITTGLVNITDIQQLDASLNRRVERDVGNTTVNTQTVSTKLLTGGLYVGKPVDTFIANSQMDITGNAFISKLGLGTSTVNANYVLDVGGSERVASNLDVSGSLTVQNNINSYGIIVQW